MNIQLNQKSTLIQEIKAILNNRRIVYFSKYPDASKQQLILDAEARISILRSASGEMFVKTLKTFNERYIYPLIPNSQSPMHKSICSLYNKIRSI